jgi:ribosomal-protein-alanine N-acetyltransferase
MRRDDIDAVVRIEADSFPTPWRHGHFLHELDHNPYSVNRVLKRRGAVVGYASVWILDGELQLNKIAIDAAHRRQGLGRRLMRRLLKLAAETRCRRVSLEVRQTNREARKLYEKLGFAEVGSRTDYYGPGEPAILMRLELREGSAGVVRPGRAGV